MDKNLATAFSRKCRIQLWLTAKKATSDHKDQHSTLEPFPVRGQDASFTNSFTWEENE
jgi:hypothetical protein